jgi:hypothetical protein
MGVAGVAMKMKPMPGEKHLTFQQARLAAASPLCYK